MTQSAHIQKCFNFFFLSDTKKGGKSKYNRVRIHLCNFFFVELLFVVRMTHTLGSQLLLKVCRSFVLVFDSHGGIRVEEV